MILLRQLIGAHWIAAGAVSAAIVAVIGWDGNRKARWVESGRQEVRVEINRETNAAIFRGTAAADKSQRVQAVRGGVPLTYRD